MSLISLTNIISIWKQFQRIIKFARVYFNYIKFTILLSLIIITMLLQSFHRVEPGNYEKKIQNLTISVFSFNPFIIFALLIGFIIKQTFNSTLFQNTVIFYIILLRGLEILPLYYLYQFIYSNLSRFDNISKTGLILYSILISLKFSNQITIYIPTQRPILLIKTRIEYFLHFLLLWKSGYNRYDLIILLNRLLIIKLYSNLSELLSNEILWKNFISFTKFNQNENKQIHRITKNQLAQLFPSINIAYEILIIRSIITSIIFYNIYKLIEFSLENSRLNILFIPLIWFLIIMDCSLLFYHTNIFSLFWFYTGLNQWNNLNEIDIDIYQPSPLYSIYRKMTYVIDEYCLKIIRNNFFQRIPSSVDNRFVPVVEPMITTVLNQNNQEEEEEENSIPSTGRIVLDLYEHDSKTPRIHLFGDDIGIQPDDVLVGFVGLTGRGKSQLLRCLTGNEIFKSGSRPTTYMAIGTLCTFDRNHRYWIIDAPGDSQATEPESHYFYKKWLDINSTYDVSFDHRIKEENGYKYEEAKLTIAVVTKYIDDLLQRLHLCVFVFDNRVDQLLKDYYNDHIIRHLGTRSRVIFARTKWDLMHVKKIDARKNLEEDERKLLIETFKLDSNRVRIVFTTGLIDNESDNDPDIIKSIREKGLTIDNLKQMIIETMNDHWENLYEEKEATKQGLPLRLSELKEGDHILYFPTLETKKPYSALIASNQNGNIQVYARTAKFVNNQRQENSSGTEYHYFSFDDFRRSTFEAVGKTVPDDYVQDPPLMIRQLYKNSTEAERDRTNAILKHHPKFKANICDISSDGPSKTLARAKSVLRNTHSNENVVFKPEVTADFVYTCKTGQQPPLDPNFWTTYNLSSVADLTGYSARALSHFTHLTVNGTAKSVCRTIGQYPIVDAVMCAVNCYQDPQNKSHYMSKAVVGAIASTVVCVAASSLTGPFAPLILYGGMVVSGETGNYLGGKFCRWKAPKNERVIEFSE